jgi:PPP family 3-phenylpropionic acid transporter
MPNVQETSHHAQTHESVRPVLRQKPVQWFLASTFFHVLSHIGIYVFFSLYLDSMGYSKTMIGLLWAVSVAVEIVWFFSQSRWGPRMPLTAWLVLCSFVMLLRMSLTAAWADVLWVLLLAQTLHAITFATHHTVCIALISHHFPGRLRGRGQALYTVIAYGFPGVIGALLGGLISEHWGLQSVFVVSVLTSGVATVTAYKVWRLQHPRQVLP